MKKTLKSIANLAPSTKDGMRMLKMAIISKDEIARCDALEIIEHFRIGELLGAVEQSLKDASPEVRMYALGALFFLDHEKFEVNCPMLLGDSDERVRLLACFYMYILSRGVKWLEMIRAILDSPDSSYHTGYVFFHEAEDNELLGKDERISHLLKSHSTTLDPEEGLYRDICSALEERQKMR